MGTMFQARAGEDVFRSDAFLWRGLQAFRYGGPDFLELGILVVKGRRPLARSFVFADQLFQVRVDGKPSSFGLLLDFSCRWGRDSKGHIGSVFSLRLFVIWMGRPTTFSTKGRSCVSHLAEDT